MGDGPKASGRRPKESREINRLAQLKLAPLTLTLSSSHTFVRDIPERTMLLRLLPKQVTIPRPPHRPSKIFFL